MPKCNQQPSMDEIEFLRTYFKDEQEEMRWRRNVEYKLFQFFLILCTILGAVATKLFEIISCRDPYQELGGAIILTIFLTALFITLKICEEHRIYVDIGEVVQRICRYFKLNEPNHFIRGEQILPNRFFDQENGYGRGPGYLWTIAIIWAIAVTLWILIGLIACYKVTCI